MKKMLLLAAVMFAVVSFSSCSDDDDKDANINPSQIVGTWEYVHYYSYDKDDIDGVDEFEYDVVKGDENWYKLVFNADGTFTKEDADGVDTSTKHYYSIKGNTITKKHVYTDGASDTEVQTITTLNSTTFVIEEVKKEKGTTVNLFGLISASDSDLLYRLGQSGLFHAICPSLSFSFRVTDFVKRLIYKTLLQSLSLSCFVYSTNNLIFIKINNN